MSVENEYFSSLIDLPSRSLAANLADSMNDIFVAFFTPKCRSIPLFKFLTFLFMKLATFIPPPGRSGCEGQKY